MSNYNSAFMGLDFNVQLLIAQPDCTASATGPQPDGHTVINLPELGNAGIRRAMTPLMPRDEQGYLASTGEIPIGEHTLAFTQLCDLKNEIYQHYNELGDKLEALMQHDPKRLWSHTYSDFLAANSYHDALSGTVNAIKRSTDNRNIHCRIIWC